MGREHPPRRSQVHRPPVTIPGVPGSTGDALDELGRLELSARRVRDALDAWDRHTRIPRGPRRLEKDPSDEDCGADARRTLDDAVASLDERHARPLRRLIARMDRRFLRTTVPDPFARPDQPWWQRRDWF